MFLRSYEVIGNASRERLQPRSGSRATVEKTSSLIITLDTKTSNGFLPRYFDLRVYPSSDLASISEYR